ncbi:DMT family transporter [Rhizorhapis sp. SPR117]|uniref:DMT family transporter n=1 Tax=Rhizorhapis sp. SPR117 TaxID=2912611 RepID=UPI00235144EB
MLAIGLRIIAIACLAVMLAAVKIAGQRGVHVVETLFYRQFLSLPLILGWLWLGPGFTSVRTARLGAHAVRATVGMAGMILNFLSVMLLPLAEATTIGFTVPIFATILSALVLKEATGIHRWTAVIVGFCGVLVIVRPDANHFPTTGLAVAIAAAMIVAVVSILVRQIGRTEATATTVFWYTVLSLPPLAIGLIFFGQAHDLFTWGLLAVVGLAGGAGQICLTGALRWAPVSVVLPMDYSSLIWATLLGWLIWDYWPGGATWAGASLIIGSGLYIAWRERIRAKAI